MADQVEEWRTIAAAPDYAVSNVGRVMRCTEGRGTYPGRILKPTMNYGYPHVDLMTSDGRRMSKVHQLVCETFVGPRPSLEHEVAHGDGDRQNNCWRNLRWVLRSENVADMMRHGTANPRRGSSSPNSKLTEAKVAAIRAAPRRRGLLYSLAAKYGVSRNVIGNIRARSNNCWPHVHAQPPAAKAD